jgi:hypothetical protein
MKLERVYLGTWHQRTNLHLEETYRFLTGGEGVRGLDPGKSEELRKRLSATDVVFNETRLNDVRFVSGRIDASLTEDGVLLLSVEGGEPAADVAVLREFRSAALEPALSHLFSRGAPIPKLMAKIEDAHVALVVGRGISEAESRGLFTAFRDEPHSRAAADGISVAAGDELVLIDLGDATLRAGELTAFVRDLTFFREFERQLHSYLKMHRRIWEDISRVREARGMRYRDFPSVRGSIMGFQKTLGIVKARLAQMEDIMAARRVAEGKGLVKLLENLGMYNFSSLFSSKKYVAHLWEMTDDYADDTLTLLETLYQENVQHELNALKIITLLTAITSFFGMNVAFPWEDRWHDKGDSTVIVIAIVSAAAFAIYYGLKIAIHNRYFVIKEEPKEE